MDSRWLAAAFSLTSVGCCVARGRRVLTPAGWRLIEAVRVGDEVMCVDVDSGTVRGTQVTGVVRSHRECVGIRVGGRDLVCTSDHPIYSPERGQFVHAGAWVAEGLTQLLVVDDGRVRAATADSTQAYVGMHDVFDLTVADDLHTFVAEGVVVHNKSIEYESDTYLSGPEFELSAAIPERAFLIRACLGDDDAYARLNALAGVNATLLPVVGQEPPGGSRVAAQLLLAGETEGVVDTAPVFDSLAMLIPIGPSACDGGIETTFTFVDAASSGAIAVTFEAHARRDVSDNDVLDITIDEL